MFLKFKDFLLLENSRSIPIDSLKAKEWVLKNSKEWLSISTSEKYPRIFRGIDNEMKRVEYLFMDPKKSQRLNEGTDRIYLVIMSNSPKWKNYDPRDRSLICATSTWNASNYGSIYVVIPSDGKKLCYASEPDIFYAFKDYSEDISFSINRFITSIFEILGIDENAEDYCNDKIKNYEDIKNLNQYLLQNGYKEKFVQIEKVIYEKFDIISSEKNKVISNFNISFLDGLEYILNPKYFGRIELNELLDESIDYELWTDKECLMVKFYEIENFITYCKS